MRGCLVLLTIAVAVAQDAPTAPPARPGTTVPSGVPLRIALEHRVAIKHSGDPILGRLVESIYVFDRMVLPAGSLVEGHIAEIGGVPASRHLKAIMSGNFTPPREVRAQFDALVLSDGSRLSIHTTPSRGTAYTARVAPNRKKQEAQRPAVHGARESIGALDRAAVLAFTEPGKLKRLRSTLLGMLPYQRQALSAGTLFSGVLLDPLTAPAPAFVGVRTDYTAVVESDAQALRARLLTPISSATARKGEPVEAVVTRPVFAADHSLLIPEGSRLLGEVMTAQPARRFHRNGKVFFMFRQLRLPAGPVRSIQGHLDGVEADFNAHLTLDSEGTTRAFSPPTRFIFPALAIAASALSFHQDYNAQGIPDQDIGGRAESGAVGLGLIGTALAQASRSLASSIAIGGAAFSLYSTFIARGEDVVLPENTPVVVSVTARGCEASGGRLAQTVCGAAVENGRR